MASGTTCDEALLESVGPALDWLSETDRQQTALAEFELNLAGLERALDEGASLEELTRLAHKCFHSDRGLPDEIQRRLEDRFQNLEVSVKRRSSCLVSIVVITVLLIGMLAGLAAYYASM